MTMVDDLAEFVVEASWTKISEESKNALKIRVLDSLGCALGAINASPVKEVKSLISEFGGKPLCSLIGGGRTSPERAALYNGALVRYLDFNDAYLAKGESCHPSDNLSSVLAAVEYAGGNGKDLLTSLAVAYQVQCRLSEVAPVRSHGFDHTTQGAYAVASGVSRALNLKKEKTMNAIAISGTAFNSLRVTRTGEISNWKGLAYPNTAWGATNATFLAMHGITGPREVFEGNKGFMDAIAGKFSIDWRKENLEKVKETFLKKYNAEVHAQSALEALLELREENELDYHKVQNINVKIFDVAYNIIGGGEEGNKHRVRTKEEADHSLPYLIAVALIDGEVYPTQFNEKRIVSKDVQNLLRRVTIEPDETYSSLFPQSIACKVIVQLKDGDILEKEKKDYEGYRTRPMNWEDAGKKFEHLASSTIDEDAMHEAVSFIKNLESKEVTELFEILGELDPLNR
jgi:2-methylcitrate dehydratase